MNLTFGRKLLLGFSIAVLVVLVIGISGHRATSELIDNDRAVEHTHEVRRLLAQLLSSLRAAESSQRGYLLTGDERFIEAYQTGRSEAQNALAGARRATADNGDQQRRVEELAPVVDWRLNSLASVIEQRKAQGLDPVAKGHALIEGKEHMEQAVRILDEMDRAELALLSVRKQRSEQAAASAQAVILWGSIAGTLLVLAVGVLISRSLTAQVGLTVRHIQASAA
jgi:CHASE3 domain sensor protein